MKKNLSVVLLIMAGIQLLFAQTAPNIKIVASAGKLSINGNNIAKDWNISSLPPVLKKASRTFPGSNNVYTYDDAGIVIFEALLNKMPSGKLSEMEIFFSKLKGPDEFNPTGYFTGSFTIENFSVNANTTFEELQPKLKGYIESDTYNDNTHKLTKDGICFYFSFDDDETHLLSITIDKEIK